MSAFIMSTIALTMLALVALASHTSAFTSGVYTRIHLKQPLKPIFTALQSSLSASAATTSSIDADLMTAKATLVSLCTNANVDSLRVKQQVNFIESLAKQAKSTDTNTNTNSNVFELMAGDWELLYTTASDVTRTSPFFWAFRQAFPSNADQIFSITDAIPAPIKEVGPAYQTIQWNNFDSILAATGKDMNTSNISTILTGRFVSRVKVATLGGAATSMMTTRASITADLKSTSNSNDTPLTLQIETTKPEGSTVVETLLGSALGAMVNENAPAFPSGAALDQIQPGSSRVVMLTTFCDEGMRITRDGQQNNGQGDISIWRRREFARFDYL